MFSVVLDHLGSISITSHSRTLLHKTMVSHLEVERKMSMYGFQQEYLQHKEDAFVDNISHNLCNAHLWSHFLLPRFFFHLDIKNMYTI